jgi:diguanylate cyclase (GGDEF)-like protein
MDRRPRPHRPGDPAAARRRWLQGIQVPDERPLAGQLTGVMYLVSSATTAALPWLPGETVAWPWLLWALAGWGACFGLLSLTVVDWTRAPAWLTHLASAAGVLAAGGAMALSGGAGAPARFLLLFPLVYPSSFYRPAEARPYLVACVATWASPLLYDQADAIDTGMLGELLIVVPAAWMLTFLMIEAKAQMMDLRAQADLLARRDALTELANRRALTEAVERRAGGRREGDRIGLLLIDVDDFKAVNTRFGHPGGDRALAAVAAALRGAAREDDLVARLGGDEFAVLVRGADADAMAALARRALAAVRSADPQLDGARLHASGGWALCPGDAHDSLGLFSAADDALRRVKGHGKDAALGAGSAVAAA